ncbi:DEKNAAC101012 [Brettanomyces naardenensis]|uniref:DEKNAAC101012 n=1 Tax=Brettanomyces naardenensis TaxID=13370 RepID=A0A448YGP7_BRENA|nr:DEKNAAC101012 [Brettanomyces naardenensis]
MSFLVNGLKPVGGSVDNELSFRTIDYYGGSKLQLEKLVPHKEDAGKCTETSALSSHFFQNSSCLRESIYSVHFKENIGLKTFKPVRYSTEQSRFINTLIRKGYGYTLYVDSRPAALAISSDDAENLDNRFLFTDNIPLGFVDRYGRAVLYNMLRFDVFYKQVSEKRFSLLYTTVYPLSMFRPHVYEDIFEAQDFKCLSQTKVTDVTWMYSVNFHDIEDKDVTPFVPRMPLELKELSSYYRKYVWNCMTVLLVPLLVHFLTARYSSTSHDAKLSHSLSLILSFIVGTSAFTVSSASLGAIFTLIFRTISVACFIVALGISSPLLGIVPSCVFSKLSHGERGTSSASIFAVTTVFIFSVADLLILHSITKDIKLLQVLALLAGVFLLMLVPGTVLGHAIYVKKIEKTQSADSPSGSHSSPPAGSPALDTSAESDEKHLPQNQQSLSLPHQALLVLVTVFACSVPFFYPASESFFFLAYSRNFETSRYLCHCILSFIQFAVPFFLSSRIFLNVISCKRYFVLLSLAVVVSDIIFWSHFLKGFKVLGTTGGTLFLQKALVNLYRWFDNYDTIYLTFFLFNSFVAHCVAAFSIAGLCICF